MTLWKIPGKDKLSIVRSIDLGLTESFDKLTSLLVISSNVLRKINSLDQLIVYSKKATLNGLEVARDSTIFQENLRDRSSFW